MMPLLLTCFESVWRHCSVRYQDGGLRALNCNGSLQAPSYRMHDCRRQQKLRLDPQKRLKLQ